MLAKNFCYILKDIIEDYRILEDSPLQKITSVTLQGSGILLGFADGLALQIDIKEQ